MNKAFVFQKDLTKEQVNDCFQVDEKNIKGFFEDYRWLSNFHPCNIIFEGDSYPSAENAYQAAKALWADRDQFFTCSPSEAKKKGALIPIDVDLWEQRKKKVMRTILWDKFTRNPDLKEKLLATGSKYLEETNWWGDVYWGVCGGVGENTLGKLLMEIRSAIRNV